MTTVEVGPETERNAGLNADLQVYARGG